MLESRSEFPLPTQTKTKHQTPNMSTLPTDEFDNGGNAFAKPTAFSSNDLEVHCGSSGMSLLDYFAGQAMTVFLQELKFYSENHLRPLASDEGRDTARRAYLYATKMIEEKRFIENHHENWKEFMRSDDVDSAS